jgi:hypothetical protein
MRSLANFVALSASLPLAPPAFFTKRLQGG